MTTEKSFAKIHSQEREASVFELGDRVVLNGFDRPIHGTIVLWHFDEGNVWEVVTDGGNIHECTDDELTPESGKPYHGNERHIYS